MQYDEVVAAFFVPTPADTVPRPTRRESVARRLRDAIEPIAMHPVWSRGTNESLARLGLDFFSAYAWGRAAALGEPAAGVVVSSFAVFEPTMITGAYDQGRQACGRDEILAIRATATTASLAAVLDGVDVSDAADRLGRAVAELDRSGRPLYAGLADLPFPDDPVGVLWRSAEMVREHRGDGHVAACVVEGLDPVAMNILTELWVGMPLGAYTASRGWDEATIAERAATLRQEGLLDGDGLSDDGLALRERIEDATDRAQDDLVDRLGADVDDLIGQLDDWSERCVVAAAFPPDAYKRAAG
ncbi:MAG: hypothetical protein ACFCVK_01945 [Acidimicrobiales bacterium]